MSDYNQAAAYEYQPENLNYQDTQYEQSNAVYEQQQQHENSPYQQSDSNYQYQEAAYQQPPNYQETSVDPSSTTQYNPDNYYTTEPGENYYNESEQSNADLAYQNAPYTNSNADYYAGQTNANDEMGNGDNVVSNYTALGQQGSGGDESSTTFSANANTPEHREQQQQQQQQFMNSNNNTAVTNYLQSDEESAAISHGNQSQNDESDFDFSVKS